MLRRPLSRRMFGDIEMNDTATVVAKDDEDEQNSEGCGRQSEKVERHLVVRAYAVGCAFYLFIRAPRT